MAKKKSDVSSVIRRIRVIMMKEAYASVNDLIVQELKWHKVNHKKSDLSPDYKTGFIAGLRQALLLLDILKADEIAQQAEMKIKEIQDNE